jgi:hypothetical protein
MAWTGVIWLRISVMGLNPLNAELNPLCYLLPLLGAHHILHVSRIRVNGHGNSLVNEGWFYYYIRGNFSGTLLRQLS